MLRKGIKIRRRRSSSTPPPTGPSWPRTSAADQGAGGVSAAGGGSRGDPRGGAEAIAGGAKDIGKVMGQVLPRFKGRADGKVDQPDRARGAAGGLMSVSPDVISSGVPAQTQGGTPSSLPAEQSADALETIEFDRRARARRRPRGRPARRRAGPRAPPHRRPRWISASWPAWARSPALFRRGDSAAGGAGPRRPPSAGAAPDRGQRARGRRARRAAPRAGRRAADAARISGGSPTAPLAGGHGAPAAGQGHRAPAGAVGRSRRQPARHGEPRLAAARREVHAARQRLLRKLEALLRATRRGHRAGRRVGDRARRPLRHPGAARLAQPPRRHRPRRVGQRAARCSSSRPRRSSWATRCARPRWTRSGRRSGCCAS